MRDSTYRPRRSASPSSQCLHATPTRACGRCGARFQGRALDSCIGSLSNVPCGCLACVYLVASIPQLASNRSRGHTSNAVDGDASCVSFAWAVSDPSSSSNYCDMAENVAAGFGGGTCYEIDLLEANNNAMQSAIHSDRRKAGSNCRRTTPHRHTPSRRLRVAAAAIPHLPR